MVADPWHGAIVPLLADEDRGGRGIAHLAVRRIDLDPAKMRMHGQVGHGVHLSKGDIGVGEVLGEFSAIDGLPRASTMIAITDCVVARMPAAKFLEMLRQNSAVSSRLIKLLVAKIRRMSERVFEVSALAVRERVRRELLRLAADGTPSGKGVVIQPSPSHYEFAARIGSHREAVTRELNHLEEEKIVAIGRREIRILDLVRLQQHGEDE